MNLSFRCINRIRVGKAHLIAVILSPSLEYRANLLEFQIVDITTEMSVQKQSTPSFALTTSLLSIVFYCVGFVRLELELHEQKNRISTLERVAESTTPPSDHPDMKLIKNAPGKFMLRYIHAGRSVE